MSFPPLGVIGFQWLVKLVRIILFYFFQTKVREVSRNEFNKVIQGESEFL